MSSSDDRKTINSLKNTSAIRKIADSFSNKEGHINLFDYALSFVESKDMDSVKKRELLDDLSNNVNNSRIFIFILAEHYISNKSILSNDDAQTVSLSVSSSDINDSELSGVLESFMNASSTGLDLVSHWSSWVKYLNINSDVSMKESIESIKSYLKRKYPDTMDEFSLILVGDHESINKDLECGGDATIITDLTEESGDLRFHHLTPDSTNNELYVSLVSDADNDEEASYILGLIQAFNSECSKLDARSDLGSLFNVANPPFEYNGKCYDLGVHHLGLLPKNVKLVKELNDAGYGISEYYGLPVYKDNCIYEGKYDCF